MTLEELNNIKIESENIAKANTDNLVLQLLNNVIKITSDFYISQSKNNKEVKSTLDYLNKRVDKIEEHVVNLTESSSQYLIADIIDHNNKD